MLPMMLDLRRVKVTPAERARMEDDMSNWDNLFAKLSRGMENKEVGERDLLKMLKVETTGRRRLAIASRLLAAYHKLCKAENERRLAAALARG